MAIIDHGVPLLSVFEMRLAVPSLARNHLIDTLVSHSESFLCKLCPRPPLLLPASRSRVLVCPRAYASPVGIPAKYG